MKRKWPRFLRFFLILLPSLILAAVAILFFYRTFVAEPFYVPSSSMEPTLLKGDVIWGRKNFKIEDLEVGDVVVFHFEGEDVLYVKRIVARGGDVVATDGDKLFLNGLEMRHPEYRVKKRDPNDACVALFDGATPAEVAAGELPKIPYFQGYKDLHFGIEDLFGKKHWVAFANRESVSSWQEWSVPPDSFFVMGDSRDNSRDSRFQGFVRADNIVAVADSIWYSATTRNYACGPQSLEWAGKFFRVHRAGLKL